MSIIFDYAKRFQMRRAERSLKKQERKEEVLRDVLHDKYYEKFALSHLNKVISSFGRQPQHSLESAMRYARNIGILQPYSDDILYMQNMKKASLFEDF